MFLTVLPLRFVRTPILPKEVQVYLEQKGVGFALIEDACKAMLKIASDTTVNGITPQEKERERQC